MLWGPKQPGQRVVRIRATLNRNVSGAVVNELLASGVRGLHVRAGRTAIVEQRSGLFGLFSRSLLADDPAELLTLIVEPGSEAAALNVIMSRGNLDAPGRGSVFSEDVVLRKAHELCAPNQVRSRLAPAPAVLHSNLAGLCAIVQRGHGDETARIALDTGTGVPGIHFGRGTGVRDKMGLLRIAIPAEKEVITVPVSSFDAEMLMDMMIDTGKLDQPGRGFIYLYPLRKGVPNLRVSRGAQEHAASMEQVIAALDQITGNSEWRRRTGLDSSDQVGRKYLSGLVEMNLTVDEGKANPLVEEAMRRGASGATIARTRHIRASARTARSVPPARESATLIVAESQVEGITEALDDAGAFSDHAHGMLVVHKVQRAFTYIAPPAPATAAKA
ncbi:MAG: hypothetical protein H7A21_16565 [Spirochaetales bacterium]|nr:hypothetical protein [Leptospiraceae bacterium]MCP5483051.1 hypothetical protein [Spirochaetales bacterium]MCP5486142.1 hypothetical protein [Spirochaetales bacterium]